MSKILINSLLLTKKLSGVEVYIENLIFELDKLPSNFEIHVIISKSYEGDISRFEKLKIVKIPFKLENRFLRIFIENIYIPYYIIKSKIDVFHSTAYVLPFFTPCKTIVTIHDLIALNFPELCQNSTATYFNIVLPFSMKKSDIIIAVSEATQKDIIAFNKIYEKKIRITHLGSHTRFLEKIEIKKNEKIKFKYNLPEKYILFVGNIEPKKNLSNLVKAFIKFKETDRNDINLVLAGRFAWKYNETIKIINSSKYKSSIHSIGYIEDDDLPYLYSNSKLFTFISIYEGFGIPALEAMACGVPLLISNRGALPEITNNFCTQVDPFDIKSISLEMQKMIENKKDEKKISEAKNWAEKFTWNKMARETLDIYKNLLYNE